MTDRIRIIVPRCVKTLDRETALEQARAVERNGLELRALMRTQERSFLMRLITSIAILAISALPALAADRPVTQDERAKLVAAAQAEGCTGGKMEFDEDDQQFEVDDAVCADGKKYDIKFDPQMKLKRKNVD